MKLTTISNGPKQIIYTSDELELLLELGICETIPTKQLPLFINKNAYYVPKIRPYNKDNSLSFMFLRVEVIISYQQK